MANIVMDFLKVDGDGELARAFLHQIQAGEFHKPFEPDDYWRFDNFDQRWQWFDTDDFDFEQAKMKFSTANLPPYEWFQHVTSAFPEIKMELHYHESGCRFWGLLKSENGVAWEEEWPWPEDGESDDFDDLIRESVDSSTEKWYSHPIGFCLESLKPTSLLLLSDVIAERKRVRVAIRRFVGSHEPYSNSRLSSGHGRLGDHPNPATHDH